jgi:hypothetical protein
MLFDNNLFHPIIFLIIVLPLTFLTGNFQKILLDFYNPIFQIYFCLLIFFSYWGLTNKDSRTKLATERGVNAFMIAYLAHLDIPFGAFIITWLFVYNIGMSWV